MRLSSVRHFPENLVCAAGWGFGFAQGEFVLPQALQPRARRGRPPAWPWCLPCLARTGDRIMSSTAFCVDLTSLLLYPRMLAWGLALCGAMPNRQPPRCGAERVCRPLGFPAATGPVCVCDSSADGIFATAAETLVAAKAALCSYFNLNK